MTGLISTLGILACVVGLALYVRGAARIIEYERVELGKYHGQVTVTDYPDSIERLFGKEPRVRVFLTTSIISPYEHVGWYEVPTFEPLHSTSGLAHAIANAVRQQEFVGSGGAPTQEGK